MADDLKNVDLDALTSEYGSTTPSALKGIDVQSLEQQYGGTVEPKTTKSSTDQPKFWEGLNSDPSWSGLAKRVGIGALRGAKDVIDTGAEGLARGTSYVADKILPENLALPIRQSAESTIAADKLARNQYDTQYPSNAGIVPTAADTGRFVGQIAATAPLMPVKAIQGINAAAGALPTILATGEKVAAPIMNRLGAAIGTGALGGAVMGGAISSSNDKTLAENIGEGALSGAVGGPLLVGASQLGKSVGGKIIGGVDRRTADLAKRAEELGIDLKATQVSDSPLLKKYDQVSGMLPFSGAQGISNNQIGQFTKAVSRTFGENTSNITPELAENARKKIGNEMNTVYKNSTIVADPKLAADLKTVFDNATATHVEGELKPVINQIRNVIGKIGPNGEIDGKAFHDLVSYNGVLSKAQQNSNPNIRNSANEIYSALQKALDRSLPTDQKEILDKARAKYKAVMTVKDLVDASADGHVSPLRLMQKVNKSPGGKLRSGELGELADIGRKFFPTPADSGTPLGETIMTGLGNLLHSPLSVGSAAGSALLSGATMLDMGAGAFGLGVNRVMRSGINSNAARRALIRSGTGETYGTINKLADVVVPYSSQITRQKDKDHPLRITVTK